MVKNKTTETGEQAAKREASLLKIHAVFLYILFWFVQNNGSLFTRKGRELLTRADPGPKWIPDALGKIQYLTPLEPGENDSTLSGLNEAQVTT